MRTGIGLLVAGILLYCVAKPMARVYISRDATGSVSTIDEGRMGTIQFVGDKLAWLGSGLVVVGAAVWIRRFKDEPATAG